jgi:hypothetical protein
VALVSGTFADRDIDGLAGRRHHQHRPAEAAVRGGAQGAHRGGLARTRGRG